METGIKSSSGICTRENSCMKRMKIKQILGVDQPESLIGQEIKVGGWVRTLRNQKTFAFIELNDGSTFSNFQLILDADTENFEKNLEQLATGVSITATGTLVESPGKGQKLELRVQKIHILGSCDPETYPLQKKRHSFEFLRTIAHLRPRTNTQGAVTRVRNALAFATHKFFQEKDFLYIQTPIITGSDCEGGGELFRVTTLEDFKDPSQDFFGKPTYLTVSGQLNAEAFACALSDVYTFGPTFRAENSHTSRHIAEFWMIEPEMAFADLQDDIDCAQSYLKFVISYVLEHCAEDLAFFNRFIEKGLLEKLKHVLESPFEILTYTDAIEILQKAPKKFEFPTEWGNDLQSEHERYLTEEHFKKPVVVIDYPKSIKAFYMRDNDDGKTVAAMDVLVPQVGELIGGSQREERLDVIQKKVKEMNLDLSEYQWYLELRKFGTVPHAGFGVGFERLVQFVTGMENIRDVIPFPRASGNAQF